MTPRPVGDDERNFYLWGAMGGAAMIGLGLAIARPDRHVLVVTGDGEILMGLGGLATIGMQRHQPCDRRVRQWPLRRDRHAADPHRHRRVVDRGGTFLRHRGGVRYRRRDGARRVREPYPSIAAETTFARVAIIADEPPRVLPTRDGVFTKNRFRRAIGAE